MSSKIFIRTSKPKLEQLTLSEIEFFINLIRPYPNIIYRNEIKDKSFDNLIKNYAINLIHTINNFEKMTLGDRSMYALYFLIKNSSIKPFSFIFSI